MFSPQISANFITVILPYITLGTFFGLKLTKTHSTSSPVMDVVFYNQEVVRVAHNTPSNMVYIIVSAATWWANEALPGDICNGREYS